MTEPDARERLIVRGVNVLSEHGFAATGLDSLLKESRVPKGSFYYYFRSKSDFVLVVIDRYAELWDRKLRRILGNVAMPPLERIERYIDESTAGMKKYGFKRGCLVGNLGQELGSLDPAIATRLAEVLDAWALHMEACLLDARAAGDIHASLNPKTLAQFFWTSWEGAVLRAKVQRSTLPIEHFKEVLLCHLRTAGAAKSSAAANPGVAP